MESWCAEVIVEIGKQSPDNQVTALLLAALKGMQIPIQILLNWKTRLRTTFSWMGNTISFLLIILARGKGIPLKVKTQVKVATKKKRAM